MKEIAKIAGKRKSRVSRVSKSKKRDWSDKRIRPKEWLGEQAPKIYFIELCFIFPLLVVADVADLFNFTGVGIVISWSLDMLVMGITTMWLVLKKRRATWFAVAAIVEFIPFIDILPIRITVLIALLAMETEMGKRLMASTGMPGKIATKILKKGKT